MKNLIYNQFLNKLTVLGTTLNTFFEKKRVKQEGKTESSEKKFFLPTTEIRENNDRFTIKADLSCASKDDIQVNLSQVLHCTFLFI